MTDTNINTPAGVKTRHCYEMTESLVRCIDAMCQSEQLSEGDKLVGAVILTIGYGLYDQLDSVDPTRFAIPSTQWQHICGQLAGNKPSGVNAAMNWMNIGPSAYDKEEN